MMLMFRPTVLLAAKEVILFTLPPNTTQLTQALDKGCFGPLKSAWHKACHDFLAQNPGIVVSRYIYSFCSVFAIIQILYPNNTFSLPFLFIFASAFPARLAAVSSALDRKYHCAAAHAISDLLLAVG